MPALQHQRSSHAPKRSFQRALPLADDAALKPVSLERSIAHLKDAFHSCFSTPPGAERPAVVEADAMVELANTNYFSFTRELSRADDVKAAIGSAWYHKLELVTKLAVAMQKYAISQSLKPDDDALIGRWSESFSIAFLAECLSRSVGYKRPSEAFVAGMVMSVLGFADSCRALEGRSSRSAAAIVHLDAREAILSLTNVERLTRELDLGKSFSTSRAARIASDASPWSQVAAACFLEVSARRNFWVAQIAAELSRTPLSGPLQRILSLRSSEIAKDSSEIARISWNAASQTAGCQETP